MDEVPLGPQSAECTLRRDRGDVVAGTDSLSAVAREFLAHGDKTLLVLGKPGGGKSAFTWRLGAQQLGQATEFLQQRPTVSTTSSAVITPWLPVHVDLKQYRAVQLWGLLPSLLTDKGALGLPGQVLSVLRSALPSLRLLVLCDGFDELQEGDWPVPWSRSHDFVAALCGGTAWSPSTLKVYIAHTPNDTRRRAFLPCHRLMLP